MKSAALCLLAIVAPGCNWLLGIDPTILVDAGPGPPGEAPLPTARLTWMIAVTDAQGLPVAAAELRAITPAPRTQIGRIAETLTDVTLDATGTFEIPRDYPGTAWRLVYQLENDIPREVHWTPGVGRVAHAIVPLYGRSDRAPIPGPNTTMSLTAPSSPTTHRAPRVFTTGVWTESQPVFPVPPGATFNYNLNQSLQLSGPPGAPERGKGDKVVLSDFNTSANCRVSEGSAAFALDLVDGVSTTVNAGMWQNSGIAVVESGDSMPHRLRTALSAGANPSAVRAMTVIGPSPSSSMPAFTLRTSLFGLRAPLALAMLECDITTIGTLPVFNLPTSLVDFPQLAHLQLTADRILGGGATLTSGLAAVTPVSAGTAPLDLDIARPVAPFMFGSTNISASDGVLLAGGSGSVVLTFGIETGQTVAEYYEVVLHRVSGGSTIPERAFTITGPSLTIERSVLAAATEYIFEIRAFRGAPGARDADFTRYSPAQTSAVMWTHSFITP